MNEHETLDILGHERLIYAIDFQTSQRCMTELRTIKNDVYELEHENEILQTNYVNLAENVNEFNDDICTQLRGQNEQMKNENEKLSQVKTKLEEEIRKNKEEIEELINYLDELKDHIVNQDKDLEIKNLEV